MGHAQTNTLLFKEISFMDANICRIEDIPSLYISEITVHPFDLRLPQVSLGLCI